MNMIQQIHNNLIFTTMGKVELAKICHLTLQLMCGRELHRKKGVW